MPKPYTNLSYKLFSLLSISSIDMLSRLSSNSNHRLLKTLIGDINNNNGSCSWYSSKRQGKERPSLYSKISPLGDPTTSLTSELDGWLRQGNKLRVAELHRIIRDFRRRKRFSHALQVLSLSSVL
ncbi:hypothetical protein Acr_15g0016700 [Actinidia rufa]|uniref:Uncharacterized protein n=1 Tax=Actinidia rufa TaxID=165716 RepID=A0A7J0FWI5_9ERIC|nr:hypothetical protein Acr_15g0016700 [Actinidia rufa]